MSAAWDSGNIPPFCNDSFRIPGFSTWKWVGLVFGWVFFWGGEGGVEEGGAGLCNQDVHCDNSYLVFNQERARRDVLAQLWTTFTEDFSGPFHQ